MLLRMKSPSLPPDWSKVHFPVECARCGHDLFGRDEPTCPACQLEFDWSDAVPLDQLKCNECGYALMGLTEQRCPECGAAFTWEDAVANHRRRAAPLFENRWREAFLRSWFTSLWWAVRPHRLWRDVSVRDTPSMAPLFIMVAVSLLAMCLLVSGQLICQWSFTSWTRGIIVPEYWAQILTRAFSHGAQVAIYAGFWECLVLLLMLPHGQFIQPVSPRKAHIVRIWAYSVCMYGNICFAIVSVLMETINGMQHLLGISQDAQYAASVAVLITWAISYSLVPFGMHRGFRQYLRVSYSWAIALATLFLSFVVFSAIMGLISRL